ncbi:MAG: GDP-mannose 4,6-dehydratase, partial [Magnetococcus sp. YQC-9]
MINLDKLTYAGNLANLIALQADLRYRFVCGDIGDRDLVGSLLGEFRPRAILHFAAESHVDRSILGPGEFIQTNVVGTFHLLELTRDYWGRLPESASDGPNQRDFRFLHVSTDEVYGTLLPDD